MGERTVIQGLLDQDIQPRAELRNRVPDIELETPVDGTEAALIDAVENKRIVFTTSRLPLTRRVLEAATDLAVVAKLGTGLDNVDLEAAADLGIQVTYTPGINALSVAEHTLGLTLATLRHTVRCQELLESGAWRDESPLGTQLSGRTVGIIGYGNVGSRFANLLTECGVDILTTDPYIQPEDTELTNATRVALEDLLDRSDVVAVTAELTDETRNLISTPELEQMQSSAYLVNTARGPIVDQSALVDALEAETIAGAGLDVYESEPLPPESPLHELDNVTLTPHIAARTEYASVECISRLAENARALLDGRSVPDRYLARPQDHAR